MIIKNSKKLSTTKKLLITSVVAISIVGAVTTLELTGMTHFFNTTDSQTVNQKKESEINSNNKKDFINTKADTNTGNTVTNKPTSSDIVLSTQRESDGSVTILTQLKNYSDGVCTLTINNGSSTYTQNAPVLYQDNFSTCAGFNVPSNTVAHGIWQISLVVTSKGMVNTKSISLEVK